MSKPKELPKRNFNNKTDNHFDKINALIDGGKYTASMDKHLDRAHAAAALEEVKGK
jgi:hypothetical protein